MPLFFLQFFSKKVPSIAHIFYATIDLSNLTAVLDQKYSEAYGRLLIEKKEQYEMLKKQGSV